MSVFPERNIPLIVSPGVLIAPAVAPVNDPSRGSIVMSYTCTLSRNAGPTLIVSNAKQEPAPPTATGTSGA